MRAAVTRRHVWLPAKRCCKRTCLHSCFRASRACLHTKQQLELRQKIYKQFTVPTRECSCWGKKWKQRKLFGSTSGHIEPGLQAGTTSCSLFSVGLTAPSHQLTGIPYCFAQDDQDENPCTTSPLRFSSLIQSLYMTNHAHVQQRKQALSQSAARKDGSSRRHATSERWLTWRLFLPSGQARYCSCRYVALTQLLKMF